MTNKERLIAIFCVFVISLTLVNAFAEPGAKSTEGYPYIDYMREYYDSRQMHSQYPPEPVFYPTFFITLPDKITCDTPIPVHGNVPEKGLLTWTIISGDYIQFANLSHNPQFSLINYFILPCDKVGTDVQINATFMYVDIPNRNPYDVIESDTRIKDLLVDRHYLFVQQSFTIER